MGWVGESSLREGEGATGHTPESLLHIESMCNIHSYFPNILPASPRYSLLPGHALCSHPYVLVGRLLPLHRMPFPSCSPWENPDNFSGPSSAATERLFPLLASVGIFFLCRDSTVCCIVMSCLHVFPNAKDDEHFKGRDCVYFLFLYRFHI